MNSPSIFFNPLPAHQKISPAHFLPQSQHGKVYADVPLNFFNTVDALKSYVNELKNLGVNVLLILPHFLPDFSAYVVKDYEKPCPLFATWQNFADFMLYVKELGMDRMIDIPFNHASWQAENLKRQWFKNYEHNGIEAGADDEDADGNRVRINWGAYILNNADHELQNYWLERVIYPHVEKMHVNAIRIDAAWGLDPEGLKRIVKETRQRCEHVWFLAENLGMSKLIKLAESGIAAGADRFFNNIYWYSGGLYIPTDIYTLYKRSKALPTCTIYSSHDTLMPAMKSYARLRSNEIKGLNDKAIVRKFVEYEKLNSLNMIEPEVRKATVEMMKQDFALAALMSSDVMFAAGSEKGIFERIDVLKSGPAEFARGIDSDLPAFMKIILQIKFSDRLFNREGTVIPFGEWKADKRGIRGYVKSTPEGQHALIAVNNSSSETKTLRLPKRMLKSSICRIHLPGGNIETPTTGLPAIINLDAGKILIITSEGALE
ncbi:MAG: hypothetical protein EOM80_05740 [Erysipelotrichia bacterium]|nr:hypothetical protein [Erysipelotrichia bacterium]